MSQVQMMIGREWNFKIPALIRYMKSSFVEDFFSTGRLMLTTYPRCVSHEEAQRRDVTEGKSSFAFHDGDHIVSGFQSVGDASYMLCTSMVENDELMAKFEVDDFMTINDPVRFADAVSRRIPGFRRGSMGACIYRKEKIVSRDISGRFDLGESLIPVLQSGDEKAIERAVHEMRVRHSAELSHQLDMDQYLLKSSDFANEAEFRIIWEVPVQVSEPFFIDCPEAVEFCSPRTPRAADAPKPPPPVQNARGAFVTGLSEEGARRRLAAADEAARLAGDSSQGGTASDKS